MFIPNRPAWVCEFCYVCVMDGDLPKGWDLVWQSAVCPSCQERVKRDGGYMKVGGGAYSEERTDPRSDDSSISFTRIHHIKTPLTLYSHPNLMEGRDVLTVRCDICKLLIASSLVDNVPMCAECKKETK